MGNDENGNNPSGGKENNSSINNDDIQKEIAPSNNEIEYIWIDKEIYNDENTSIYKNIFIERNINCKKYANIDESFNYLMKKENNFKEIIIIISGRLFNNFYYKIKNNIKLITFSPIIIVFTSQKYLNFFINQLKMNNIYYNNDIFDTRYIFTKSLEIEDFIENKIQKEKEITFDLIDNEELLIIPNFYSYILEDANQSEIDFFNNYLIKEFQFVNIEAINPQNKEELLKLKNKEIHKLINQIRLKKIPKEILIKYWLKIYSLNSEFYYNMNKSLRYRDKRVYFFYPFIKLCYEGIRKDFIKPFTKTIYRCSKMDKIELIDLRNKFYSINNNNKKEFPNLIVFTRYFLSFSADINKAKKFKGSSEETFCIMFIVHEIDKENIKIYNANIEEFSEIPSEKEVLVFPFSCFEIIEIKWVNSDGIDYEIHLKYLGYYHEIINQKLTADFLDKIQISTFSEKLLESGLIKYNDFFSVWKKKEQFEIKFDKICFFLDDMQTMIGYIENKIIVFNIYENKIKQIIKVHKNPILNLIKYSSDIICSYSQNEIIKMIKLIENNTKYKIVNIIDLAQNSPRNILVLNNKDILCLDDFNHFLFYPLNKEAYNGYYDSILTEKCKILIMKELNNDKIAYIAEDNFGNKLLNFIDLKEKVIEKNYINLEKEKEEEKENKLNLVDLLVFNDYLLIVYDHGIDVINYKDLGLKMQSLINYHFQIINAIILSPDKIILALYDSEKEQSIIREHLLRLEDLHNNFFRFDCIGQGQLKLQKIANIIKINDSQILINIKSNYCFIYERKNLVSEKLKENLLTINTPKKIIVEEKEKNENKIIEKKENKQPILENKYSQEDNLINKQNLGQGNLFENENVFKSNESNPINIINNNCQNLLNQDMNSLNINKKEDSIISSENNIIYENTEQNLLDFLPEANKEHIITKSKTHDNKYYNKNNLAYN